MNILFRFILRMVLALSAASAAHAHIEYYDLNQGAQIGDLTAAGKTASTAQYGATPDAVLNLVGAGASAATRIAYGIGGAISTLSDRPLNDKNLWNSTNQSYTGVGVFSNVTYTPTASTATVDVNDVTDYGWGNGATPLLGDSHKVDFFNFRLSQTSTVTITWNVDDGAGNYFDSAFTLYSGVLNFQGHDDANEKLNPSVVPSGKVQDVMDGPTDANGNSIPVDVQGIASSYRNTTASGPGTYVGQFNALANWGQANVAGDWGNIEFLQAANGNAAAAASGYSSNPADTMETLTTTLPPGNYSIAASGALNALANSALGTLGAVKSFSLSNLHGHLTFNAVASATTTTALVSDQNPASVGAALTFTATVSGNSPTGTVLFKDGSATLETINLSNGKASYTVSSLGIGTHGITAAYQGDSNNSPSISNVLSQVINPGASATTLTSSENPSQVGTTVTFTASVSGSNPTGTVTFMDGTSELGAATLAGNQATYSTNSLVAGSHAITAVYQGDAANGPSTSSQLLQEIQSSSSGGPDSLEPTTTTLSSSRISIVYGEKIFYSAYVSGTTKRTGSVMFMDGSTEIAKVPLRRGRATISLRGLAAGTHTISAGYEGDKSHAASTGAAISTTVSQFATTTKLRSSRRLRAGKPTVLVATIRGRNATGHVTFLDNGTPLGDPVALQGKRALFEATGLAVGTHSFSASYSGDTNNTSSNSIGPLMRQVR